MSLADKYKIIFKLDNSFVGISFVEGFGISGYKNLDFVAVYENRNLEAFLSEEDIKKASKIGFDFCVKREKTKKLHQGIKQLLKKVRKFWAELDETDFSKLNSNELKDLFIKYVEFVLKLWDYFSLTEFYYFSKVEDSIQIAINSKNDLSVLLTSPKRANILAEEQFKRIELALRIKNNPDRKDYYMNQHLKSFDYIPYAGGLPKLTIDSLKNQLQKLLKRPISKLEAERNKILENDERLKEQQEQILTRLKLSEEILNLILSVKEWQEIKWLLRVFINRTFVSSKSLEVSFLKEVARRTGYSFAQISNMYYQEQVDLFSGKRINKREIKARIGLYAAFNQNGKTTFLFGDKVKDFAQEVRGRTIGYYQKFTELKGRTASPGVAMGKARVFGGQSYNLQAQFQKMKKGEILVVESTSPEYMPAILKASAIVADEGGITSHAAIISRELKIPCVVGTHFAIRNIKTGDIVEVNADSGIVRILTGGGL